jgi:hypothetical protein
MRTATQGRLNGRLDLVLAITVALAALVAALLNLPPILRLILAVPLVLFLPGYALVSALFAMAPIPTVEKLVISIGSSIALGILVGFGLAWPAIGLGPLSWTIALAGMTIVGSIIAWIRRPAGQAGPVRGPSLRRSEGILLAIAAVALVGIFVGTRVIASGQETPPPAQLWMIAADDGATDVNLGVRADTPGGDYTIRLTSAGATVEEFSVTLAAGEVWERVLSFTEEQRERPIVARLYQEPEDAEIRLVVLQPLQDGN